jgi:hypothetical protein
MKTQPEPSNTPTAIPTVRDDIRKSNPRLRTADDPWVRRAMVVSANGTR